MAARRGAPGRTKGAASSHPAADDGAKAAHRGVDDSEQADEHRHVGRDGGVPIHRCDNDLFGRNVDDEGHPEKARQQEHARA